jgi:arginine deiminase
MPRTMVEEPVETKKTTPAASTQYGVHSEVGKLRKVLVCSPGLAHTRLTPTNCEELLFDDVLWVHNAKRDHFDFVTKMRERGVEVVEMHNLLTEVVSDREAKKWILDRQIVPNEVGLGLVTETRSFLDSLDSRTLAEFLPRLGNLWVIWRVSAGRFREESA